MIDCDDMRRVLTAIRIAVDDAEALTTDMLKPPRLRELGPALHRANYLDARSRMLSGLDYLMSLTQPAPEPEGGDPSGNGGAGPVH